MNFIPKKNQKLMKQLIKKDYEIPLDRIDDINFIMNETNCKTVKDWDKVNNYLNQYTKKTIDEGHDFWTFKHSLSTYVRYLETFKPMKEKELFPREDIHYLTECMERLTYNVKHDFYKFLNLRIKQKYNEGYRNIKEMVFEE